MSLSELCLECGLCCDGTLFRHLELGSGERERLVPLGIGVSKRRRAEVMLLPCGKLSGRCCTIYEARPAGCARYVCELGRRLTAKEVTFDDALAEVRAFQARLAELGTLSGAGPGDNALRHARERVDAPGPVSEALLRAVKEVEALRYAVFSPPPGSPKE